MILPFECDEGHRFGLVYVAERDDDEVVSCPLCQGPVNVLAETVRLDPRELGGDISGPGGPFDFGQTVIDARHAVLMDYLDVVRIDDWSADEEAFALLIQGRIHRTIDRASVMVACNLDALASIVTEIHGVAQRAHQSQEFMALCEKRWREMPH